MIAIIGNKSSRVFAAAALLLLVAGSAEAQAPIGVRAQGLAGAFVGVADDASALYWNPSGLATGAFVSFVVDYGRRDAGVDQPRGPGEANRQNAGLVAFSLPPVSMGYYRVDTFAAGPPEAAVTGPDGREEVRRSVHALATSVLGVAVLQSVGEYVVVGGTLKWVHGEVARGQTSALLAGRALDDAAAMPRRGDSTGDVDLSAMSAVGHVRLGVVARNLTTPSFALDETGTEAVELQREVRIGGAWGSGWPGNSRVIVAVDADAMSRAAQGGDRRDLAAGVETWWLKQRLGVRGGVRGSTLGDSRAVVAGGVSGAVTGGIFLEAHVARGQDEERSWSVGARFAF